MFYLRLSKLFRLLVWANVGLNLWGFVVDSSDLAQTPHASSAEVCASATFQQAPAPSQTFWYSVSVSLIAPDLTPTTKLQGSLPAAGFQSLEEGPGADFTDVFLSAASRLDLEQKLIRGPPISC